MSYKCDRCQHYTADGDKHICINDLYGQLQIEADKLRDALDYQRKAWQWMKYGCPNVDETKNGNKYDMSITNLVEFPDIVKDKIIKYQDKARQEVRDYNEFKEKLK